MASPRRNRLSGLNGYYSREQLLKMKAGGGLGVLGGIINLKKPAQKGFWLKNGVVTIDTGVKEEAPKPPEKSVPVEGPPPTGVFVTVTRGKGSAKKREKVEVYPRQEVGKRKPMIYSDAVLEGMKLPEIKKYMKDALGFSNLEIKFVRRPDCLKLIKWLDAHYEDFWALHGLDL